MSLVAIDKGFTFDFVEGELSCNFAVLVLFYVWPCLTQFLTSGDMLERSPFTFADFFKQRRRWMQGIFMVAATPTIKTRTLEYRENLVTITDYSPGWSYTDVSNLSLSEGSSKLKYD